MMPLFFIVALSLFPFLSAQQAPYPVAADAFADKQWVAIYGDFVETPETFGYSAYRSLIHHVSLSLLQKSNSLWLPNEEGWLTAVVLDRQVAENLKNLPASRYLSDLGGVYRLQYQGIDLQFSFEAAPREMLQLVRTVYQGRPEDATAVEEHYRRNYVIRIYRAENVFATEKKHIDFAEALVSATLIGDTYQMLWGIHDGYNLLEKIR